ncbi:hypothetical protein l11_01160 [Neisseria weaveri LMG 5135]|nr:hypothetical protein l11_01160 [Neisseria weaveri LMG 5135]
MSQIGWRPSENSDGLLTLNCVIVIYGLGYNDKSWQIVKIAEAGLVGRGNEAEAWFIALFCRLTWKIMVDKRI